MANGAEDYLIDSFQFKILPDRMGLFIFCSG